MKVLRSMLTALVLVLGLLVPTAVMAPAQAATVSGGSSNANVYLVVRDSVCKKSGVKARGIIGTVMTSRHSWTLTHYDMGDNIIYPRVRLNTTNKVILKVKCQKRTVFWRDVSLRDVVVNIKPTKHKQTIWVG